MKIQDGSDQIPKCLVSIITFLNYADVEKGDTNTVRIMRYIIWEKGIGGALGRQAKFSLSQRRKDGKNFNRDSGEKAALING